MWWVADRRDRVGNERRLSAIASQIAGRDVRVSCPGPIGRLFGWDIVEGSVRFGADGKPHDETKIRKQSCAELDALAEGRRRAELECIARARIACGPNGRETVMAVDVLAHESWHLRGMMDEGVTECRSLQTMAWTAQQLGATAEQGHALALAQYNGAYKEMPQAYRDGAARTAASSTCGPTTTASRSRSAAAGGYSCTRASARPARISSRHQATVSASVVSSGISGSQPVAARRRSALPRISITSCARTSAGSTRGRSRRPRSGRAARTARAARPSGPSRR